jgi:hypothetical protein
MWPARWPHADFQPHVAPVRGHMAAAGPLAWLAPLHPLRERFLTSPPLRAAEVRKHSAQQPPGRQEQEEQQELKIKIKIEIKVKIEVKVEIRIKVKIKTSVAAPHRPGCPSGLSHRDGTPAYQGEHGPVSRRLSGPTHPPDGGPAIA